MCKFDRNGVFQYYGPLPEFVCVREFLFGVVVGRDRRVARLVVVV